MNTILLAIVSVTVIGLLCGIVLSVLSKLMEIKEDPRITKIRECLPGANCGACGYAGCDGYSKALVEDIEKGIKTNLCIPGGETASKLICSILEIEEETFVAKVAFACCSGTNDMTGPKMDYEGIQSCKAALLLFGGKGTCTYGCLGYGDCASVCPEKAICVDNGIAQIDSRKCIGCGICVKMCPNHVISIIPCDAKVLVTCRNKEKGVITRQKCHRGCIGCFKCQKVCPVGAITVIDNLASIDYDLCIGCGLCADNCVTGSIIKR